MATRMRKVLFFLLISFFGCKNDRGATKLKQEIVVELIDEAVTLEDLFEDYAFLNLTHESLINSILKFYKIPNTSDWLFFETSRNSLFRLSEKGVVTKLFDRIGQGRGEVLQITDIDILPDGQGFFVLDNPGGKFIHLSSDFEIEAEYPIKKEFANGIYSMGFLEKGRLLLHTSDYTGYKFVEVRIPENVYQPMGSFIPESKRAGYGLNRSVSFSKTGFSVVDPLRPKLDFFDLGINKYDSLILNLGSSSYSQNEASSFEGNQETLFSTLNKPGNRKSHSFTIWENDVAFFFSFLIGPFNNRNTSNILVHKNSYHSLVLSRLNLEGIDLNFEMVHAFEDQLILNINPESNKVLSNEQKVTLEKNFNIDFDSDQPILVFGKLKVF